MRERFRLCRQASDLRPVFLFDQLGTGHPGAADANNIGQHQVLSDVGRADAARGAEARLGQAGRVLLRLSGTEPLVRVMVEGQDAALVDQEATRLAEVVAQVYAD